jgi:hypothetical protein
MKNLVISRRPPFRIVIPFETAVRQTRRVDAIVQSERSDVRRDRKQAKGAVRDQRPSVVDS